MRKGLFFVLVIAVLVGLAVFFSIVLDDQVKPADKKNIPIVQNNDFVRLDEYIPSLEIDLIYATENNFTGKRLYENDVAYLRRGTADKLKNVADEAAEKGYRLKVWDAYRPPSVQFILWQAYPDQRFVANPHKGFSVHSRGCAVDLTLIDFHGKELNMPTPFDQFTPKANRDYSDVSLIQAGNAKYLEELMTRHGFLSIFTEWWHFNDTDLEVYDVAENFQ